MGIEARVNPQIPIPRKATEVHGICDDDVRDKPSFPQIAREVAQFLEGCDLAGFNILRYDLPLLRREFERAGVPFSTDDRAIVDALRIYYAKEPRNLEAACRFNLNETHEEAHGALTDARMTWRVLNAQLALYGDLPRTAAALDAEFNDSAGFVDPERKFEWKAGHATFAFGRYRGLSLSHVAKKDPDYLRWIVEKGDFNPDTKRIVGDALRGIFPQQKKQTATTQSYSG